MRSWQPSEDYGPFDLGAGPAGLALDYVARALGLHQIVDQPPRNTVNILFSDDAYKSLPGRPAQLRKVGEAASLAGFGDLQRDPSASRVPLPVTVCVAQRFL